MVPDHKDVRFVVHFHCRLVLLRFTVSTCMSEKQIIIVLVIIISTQQQHSFGQSGSGELTPDQVL